MNLLLSKQVRVFVFGGLLCACSAIGVSRAAAQQTPAPDNSKANQTEAGMTADQQGNNQSDRELAQNVRRAIMQDKSLKGPVRSEDEKQAIEAKAAEVAGKANVASELTVATHNR
jgi:hyperosmotically inducible periplasmic protein